MTPGSLLAALGLAALRAEARAIARRLGIRLAAGAVSGLLALTGLGLAIAAFTVWLAGEVGTINALLIDAAAMLALAGLIQLVAKLLVGRRRPPPQAAPAGPPPDPAAPPPGSVLGSMAVVGLLGFLLARQIFRR